MNEIDDDASYFDITVAKPETEKVWCKIGDAGNLEYVRWDVVKKLAEQFDSNKPENRTEQMLIAKLMWLVREETRKEFASG